MPETRIHVALVVGLTCAVTHQVDKRGSYLEDEARMEEEDIVCVGIENGAEGGGGIERGLSGGLEGGVCTGNRYTSAQ